MKGAHGRGPTSAFHEQLAVQAPAGCPEILGGLSMYSTDDPAARSRDHHDPAYLHGMALRVLLLPLLFLSFRAAAQTPSPCAVVMPEIVSPNSEVPAQATCTCRITACEVKVFNRWAKEVWSGTTLEAALLNGFSTIGCEEHEPYIGLIEQRLSRVRDHGTGHEEHGGASA